MTRVIRSLGEVRRIVKKARRDGKTIGFVPTMGYFHEGHLSLFRRARAETGLLVVSVYVNPAQFAPHENYKRYPRDFKRDFKLAEKEKVDILFNPADRQMYPDRFSTFVCDQNLSKALEGKSRPVHFRGVLTVLAKLFHLTVPDAAYFGQKDYQQALLVQRMVRDLDFDIKIRVLPTVREEDGLAMSSRNHFLKREDRVRAVSLFSALQQGRDMISSGMRNSTEILKRLRGKIQETPGVKVDYLEIVDPATLRKIKRVKKRVLLAGAVWIRKTRLIDNLLVDV